MLLWVSVNDAPLCTCSRHVHNGVGTLGFEGG